MIPILPRANLEDGTARAIRSLLHREMTGKISARSAQMAMERIVPKLEPARVQPTSRLDETPDPLTPASYDDAMGAACRAMCEGRISPAEAEVALKLGAGGNIRTQTLKAFDEAAYRKLTAGV
jgi:hypothetical protein